TESLSFHVTAALLALGTNFNELKETVTDGIWAFTNACSRATESVLSPSSSDIENPQLVDAVRTANIAVAILGFLDAASAQADFWKASTRLGLIQKVKQLLSEPFLVAVETALSTIRNSHSDDRHVKEWKRYLRHYATAGRPLGAMLLQRSFTWLVLASTSLMVADGSELRKAPVLDVLMSEDRTSAKQNGDVTPDAQSIEMHASFAIDQMEYIEAGADFLRLGSVPQQKLAYAVKSAAIISYLNCSMVNEEAADSDVLMGWLQETLEDPVQMADETMASATLQSLALVCRITPPFASTVSRVLPKFIVQASPRGRTVSAASKSLAFVLKMLSKDAIISTLYSLGNVLSPEGEGTITTSQVNGSVNGENGVRSVYPNQQSTGSSMSFDM
ncbi:hypothetical protein Golomagni_07932, partial [Golovinomyces magnicellulatus]